MSILGDIATESTARSIKATAVQELAKLKELDEHVNADGIQSLELIIRQCDSIIDSPWH